MSWDLASGVLCRFFFDRTHPIIAVGVDLDAVYLTFEAGESLAELLHCDKELDHG